MGRKKNAFLQSLSAEELAYLRSLSTVYSSSSSSFSSASSTTSSTSSSALVNSRTNPSTAQPSSAHQPSSQQPSTSTHLASSSSAHAPLIMESLPQQNMASDNQPGPSSTIANKMTQVSQSTHLPNHKRTTTSHSKSFAVIASELSERLRQVALTRELTDKQGSFRKRISRPLTPSPLSPFPETETVSGSSSRSSSQASSPRLLPIGSEGNATVLDSLVPLPSSEPAPTTLPTPSAPPAPSQPRRSLRQIERQQRQQAMKKNVETSKATPSPQKLPAATQSGLQSSSRLDGPSESVTVENNGSHASSSTAAAAKNVDVQHPCPDHCPCTSGLSPSQQKELRVATDVENPPPNVSSNNNTPSKSVPPVENTTSVPKVGDNQMNKRRVIKVVFDFANDNRDKMGNIAMDNSTPLHKAVKSEPRVEGFERNRSSRPHPYQKNTKSSHHLPSASSNSNPSQSNFPPVYTIMQRLFEKMSKNKSLPLRRYHRSDAPTTSSFPSVSSQTKGPLMRPSLSTRRLTPPQLPSVPFLVPELSRSSSMENMAPSSPDMTKPSLNEWFECLSPRSDASIAIMNMQFKALSIVHSTVRECSPLVPLNGLLTQSLFTNSHHVSDIRMTTSNRRLGPKQNTDNHLILDLGMSTNNRRTLDVRLITSVHHHLKVESIANQRLIQGQGKIISHPIILSLGMITSNHLILDQGKIISHLIILNLVRDDYQQPPYSGPREDYQPPYYPEPRPG
ncbi:hypothetical protein BGZ94_002874 [Podila epigama]|nr:hypothetical protein BGZ94_002874 [Podila epigama]